MSKVIKNNTIRYASIAIALLAIALLACLHISTMPVEAANGLPDDMDIGKLSYWESVNRLFWQGEIFLQKDEEVRIDGDFSIFWQNPRKHPNYGFALLWNYGNYEYFKSPISNYYFSSSDKISLSFSDNIYVDIFRDHIIFKTSSNSICVRKLYNSDFAECAEITNSGIDKNKEIIITAKDNDYISIKNFDYGFLKSGYFAFFANFEDYDNIPVKNPEFKIKAIDSDDFKVTVLQVVTVKFVVEEEIYTEFDILHGSTFIDQQSESEQGD